jgi:hypothetical protein
MEYTDIIKHDTPIGFEISIKNFLAEFLKFENLETTEIKGDYGADLIGEYKNEKYVIQIKKYSQPVNLKAVQEVYSAKEHYNATRCMVVTNNTFTDSAITLAKSTNCILVDGNNLNRIFKDNCKAFDEEIEYLKKSKNILYKFSNEQLIEAFLKLKNELGKVPTVEEMDKKGLYSSSVYRRRWGGWNNFLKSLSEKPNVRRGITKEELVEEFKRIYELIGQVPTIEIMKKEGKYALSLYGRRFGSWNKFLQIQNLQPVKKNIISKEEFISEFKCIKTLLKHIPTKTEFQEHGAITASVANRIWGSWNDFLRSQGIDVISYTDQDLIKLKNPPPMAVVMS